MRGLIVLRRKPPIEGKMRANPRGGAFGEKTAASQKLERGVPELKRWGSETKKNNKD